MFSVTNIILRMSVTQKNQSFANIGHCGLVYYRIHIKKALHTNQSINLQVQSSGTRPYQLQYSTVKYCTMRDGDNHPQHLTLTWNIYYSTILHIMIFFPYCLLLQLYSLKY